MTTNGFFAVGRQTFIQACDLGMNPACTFLAMACGTGKDNATTKWSAEAVSNHIGVRWTTAKEAIKDLLDASLVTLKPGKISRPNYKLNKDGDLIWLPKALIEGAANEVAPVSKLRQTQDVMMLRLLVELYCAQNLREDGGVSTKVMRYTYERNRAGQHGAYVIWDFHKPMGWVTWGDVSRPHRREKLTKKETEAEKNAGVDFFHRIERLKLLGLIEWVPYLFDGEDGEPIHPVVYSGLEAEQALFIAVQKAVARMTTETQREYQKGTMVPVLAHVEQVQLISMMRLRYRPQTKLTAAWFAEHHSVCEGFTATFNTLAQPVQPAKNQTGKSNDWAASDWF